MQKLLESIKAYKTKRLAIQTKVYIIWLLNIQPYLNNHTSWGVGELAAIASFVDFLSTVAPTTNLLLFEILFLKLYWD